MSCRTSPESRRRKSYSYVGMTKGAFAGGGLAHARSVSEEIKDYAENTMNELLGWYGYGKVGPNEPQNLARHRPSSSSSSPQGTSPKSRLDDVSDDMSDGSSSIENEALPADSESAGANPNVTITCAWCQKKGLKLFTLKTSSGQLKTFCSELCFDQCRRATFKKNRTCDWCKHIRHTVNYVDFQDKDHQLQFCSNKCLNQYKMNIFCKETQAYLQLHPQESSGNGNSGCSRSNSPNLITPELWLRDCKDSETGASDEDETLEKPSTRQDRAASPPTSTLKEEQCVPSDLSINHRKEIPPIVENNSKLDLTKTRKRKLYNQHHVDKPEMRYSRLPIPKFSGNSKKLHSETGLLKSNSPALSYAPLMNDTMTSPIESSPSASSSQSVLLPPPPPLLSSEHFHLPPPVYHPPQPPLMTQQHHNFMTTMENNFRSRISGRKPSFLLPDAPLNLTYPSSTNSIMPPAPSASVVLPYPLVIPFPIPIPIPIPLPLSQFLNTKPPGEKGKSKLASSEEQAKRVDDIISRLVSKHNAHKDGRQDSEVQQNQQGYQADSSVEGEATSESPSAAEEVSESSGKSKRKTFSGGQDRLKRPKVAIVNS